MSGQSMKLSSLLCAMMPFFFLGALFAQYPFGGYDFPDATAFADEASESGDPPLGAGLLANGASTVNDALTDINLGSWVIAGGNQAMADIRFTDNVIVNESGDDFVVFEYGTGDTYGVAVSTNGTAGGLTAMIDYSGTQAIDLDDFGLAAGATVSFIRIQPNKQPGPGTGEWSADIQEVGALHSDSVPAEVADTFDFNDGTDQGWTVTGAYDEDFDGPFSSAFAYVWVDNTNYPNPPGNDPLGDSNGAVSLFTMGGHGVSNPDAEWWIMRFHSPDLSGNSTWQAAKGYTVEIAECMASMTSCYANLNVVVYDHDQAKDREFYNGNAQELGHDSFNDGEAEWNHLTFGDWTAISGFPENYTIKQLYVNIFGKMNGYHEGGLYFDEVVPIADDIPSGAPSAPSNLQVQTLSDQFHIHWQDHADDEQGFVLEHYSLQTFPPSWSTLATLDADITCYQMDNPTLNVTHHFRVKAFNEHGSSGYSNEVDALFLMSLSWISIQAPNGGEVWAPGSIQEISWTNSSILGPTQVMIWYSTDGGSNWIEPPVASNYTNTGSCLWTVPDTPSENCILKIADASDGSPYDLSHDPFTIGVATAPVLSVSPLTLDFGTETTQMTFQISNSGTGTLTWNAGENPDAPWITSVSPASGTGSATVTVDVDRSPLAGESGSGTISVTSNGGNQDVTVLIEKQPVDLPEDWTHSDNTGNNANVILPVSANPNIDGILLVQGDYIGAFTPAGLCCGWTEWQAQNASVTVWGDNSQTPETDGFKAGETIAYRVYRPSEDREWIRVSVAYSQGSGLYASDAILILSQFDVSEFTVITLNYIQGWNLFSINVDPADPDVETVMTPVADHLIILKNGGGQTYFPDYDINHIGQFDFKQGYKGYFDQAVSLDITGLPVDPATPIALPAGWSMIAYLPDLPMDAETALAGLDDPLVIAKDGLGKAYLPEYGINQIGSMQPGQGYQVYLDAAGTLIYPDASSGLPKLRAVPGDDHLIMAHFQFSENTGENATVVITTDIQPGYSDGTCLTNQDEIGVFTSGGLCCGAAVWEEENTAITVWGDDSQTDTVDGFQSGDTLRFFVYCSDSDREFPAVASDETGNAPVYQADGIFVLSELMASLPVGVEEGQEGNQPVAYKLSQNSPNPFNPTTLIRYDVPEPCFVSLNVYDLRGRLIETLVHERKEPGVYSARWFAESLCSGIYFIRLKAGHFTRTRKAVLSR